MNGDGRNFIYAGVLLAAAVLLFARLGHYAIWDDEAMTALASRGILRTGDTLMQPDDHNIVAYRGGILLRDLRDRSTPPFSSYLTAASFAVFGQSALTARWPCAFFGLATVALLLWWLHQARADALTLALFAMAILGNVSFFLYSRQCRYYAPAVFFSTGAVYFYWHRSGRVRDLCGLAAMSMLLFAANYLSWGALYACLAADYLFWGRKEKPFAWWHWLVLFGPQVITNGLIASVWNPLRTQFGGYVGQNTPLDRLTLFAWNLRDLNACEFLVGALVLAAPVVAWRYRQRWLLRALLALLIYVAAITAVSPQVLKLTTVADVRYLVPLIPLCLFIEVLTLRALPFRRAWVPLAIAAVAFGSNLLHGGPLLARQFHFTFAQFLGELADPPDDPYTATARWLNDHVPAGASVWIVPEEMTYSLMFHAPQAVYAWQLTGDNTQPQFAGLPPVHFQGKEPPDYIVVFGPVVQQVAQMVQQWSGLRYERADNLHVYWHDLFRPELFWRSFTPVYNYNYEMEGVQIFRRQK